MICKVPFQSSLEIISGRLYTAVLAALGSNIAAKRVAGAHVLFNVIGTVLCLILLVPFTALIQWFKSVLGLTPEMTIAFAHGTFNIANTIVQFPFIGLLAYLVTKIIPGEDEINKYEALYLDRLLITQAPAIALGNAKKELVHLASYAIQSLELPMLSLLREMKNTSIRLRSMKQQLIVLTKS